MGFQYIGIIGKRLFCQQTCTSTLVYLDKWALNKIALTEPWRTDFIAVMKKRPATLLISFVHLVEMAKQKDDAQIEQYADLLNAVDAACIAGNPDEVIENEKTGRLMAGIQPWEDRRIVEELAKLPLRKGRLYPPTAADLLRKMRDEIGNGATIRPETYERRLNPLLERLRKNPKEIQRLRIKRQQLKAGDIKPEEPLIKNILEMALLFIVNAGNMPNKEWNDFFHTIVPIAYSNYVVLDRRWHHFADHFLPFSYPSISKVYHTDFSRLFSDIQNDIHILAQEAKT